MPYYYITILLYDKRVIEGVREHPDHRIDQVFRYFKNQAEKHFSGSQIMEYDCMMVSRQGPTYQSWLYKKQMRANKGDYYANLQFDLDNTPFPDIPPSPSRKESARKNQGNWGEQFKKS